jgi:translation initiation factor IF-3
LAIFSEINGFAVDVDLSPRRYYGSVLGGNSFEFRWVGGDSPPLSDFPILRRPASTPAGVTLYVALARRQPTPENRDSTRINQNIRISPIRVVSEEGEQLGILPTEVALERAREAGLDLVEVAPNERPPVCRIMDYGKFKYEKNKKKGGGATHTKTKEIRLRPKTGDEDIRTKVKQAEKFLQHKDKVQVTVMFRGREMAHIEEGRKVMELVLAELAEFGKVEAPPQQNGKRMIAMLTPK